MIITRTPLRVSLAGGGTDFPTFYNVHGGAVLSFTINKYVYITVSEKFDGKTRLSYSHTEIVDDPAELQHDIARETLKLYGEKGLEITTVADVPSYGTGLGSSSAFAVGLIKALSARNGERCPAKMLAETAFTVESTLCGHPVGKQDQYAAAFGGVHFYEFTKGNISVEPILLNEEQKTYLEARMMLFHVDLIRNSERILEHQRENLAKDDDAIGGALVLRNLAYELRNRIVIAKDLTMVGACLNSGWKNKKRLEGNIGNKYIQSLIDLAIRAGASGGKLCGAGGGGFLLIFAEPETHQKIRDVLNLRQMPFSIEMQGSEVIYDSAKTQTAVY